MDLVTVRRTCMNMMFLHARVGSLVILLGVTVCAAGALGELATLAASAGAVSVVAAIKAAMILLFIVVLPLGQWLGQTGPVDHAATVRCEGALSAIVRSRSSRLHCCNTCIDVRQMRSRLWTGFFGKN